MRNSKRDRKAEKKESFVQQYLWLEEDIYPDKKPQIKKEEAEERGVIVIDMV